MSRADRLGVCAVALACSLATGCTGSSGHTSTLPSARDLSSPAPADAMPARTYSLPTDHWKHGDGAFLARSGGRFHAWRTADGACAGWSPRAVTALWPAGYHVAFSPTRLIDAHGDVIAREGDEITVVGGLLPAPAGTRCLHGEKTFAVMGPPQLTGRR